MERRQQWLGYVAIGIGMLALLVALGGRGDERRMMRGEYGYGGWERSAPPMQVAPVPAQPQAPAAAPQAPRMEEEYGFRHQGGPPWMMGRQGDGWGDGHPGMFFGPGMLLGGLAKLALIFLLFSLGLRFLRGRRGPHGGPPAHGGGGTPPSGPPSGGTPTVGPTVRL